MQVQQVLDNPQSLPPAYCHVPHSTYYDNSILNSYTGSSWQNQGTAGYGNAVTRFATMTVHVVPVPSAVLVSLSGMVETPRL